MRLRKRLLPLTLGSAIAMLTAPFAGSATAAAGCSTTTPALNQPVTCTSAGTESITIPAGATAVRVVAIGGGGAAGAIHYAGDPVAAGGAGAQVTAVFLLPGGTSSATVVIAAAGVSGQPSGYSAVTAGALLAVAGGGGEGGAKGVVGEPGGDGGSGAAAGTAAGGNGGHAGIYVGGDGASGSGDGGLGCDGGESLDEGKPWTLGGTGGGFSTGARGGSGYGGGGGGCDQTSISMGGGGGGGSYANAALVTGVASFAPSTGPAGLGGSGTARLSGSAGSVTLTFVGPDPDAPAPILQQLPTSRDGTCVGIDDADVAYGTTVSGGWSLSWAQWINAGSGGPVCGRTLQYAFGGWRVAL